MIWRRIKCIAATVCVLAGYATYADAQALSPDNFEQLYSMAARGDLSGISNAVHRGLNIDTLDEFGDTGLCVAARRHNRVAWKSFFKAGANSSHPCTWNISGYDDFAQSALNVSVTNTDAMMPGAYAKEGLSLTTKALIGVGTVAAAGAGVAVAASGGGGGGGSKKKKNHDEKIDCGDKILGGDGKCHERLACANGSMQVDDYCDCGMTDGYEGILCDIPVDCSGYEERCGEGYVNTGAICKSAGKIYYKCRAITCGPEYYAECPDGYVKTGEECESEGQVYYKCMKKDCAAEGFVKTSCDVGYKETAFCYSGETRYVKCDACDTGYGYYGTDECHKTLNCVHGSQTGDACICLDGWHGVLCDEVNDCTGYTVDCEIGYHKSDDTCKSGYQVLYKCVENDCAGQGYHYTECPTGYVETDRCYDSTTRYVKCDACAAGYDWHGTDECHKDLDCQNGSSQLGDLCVCVDGWLGTLCDKCTEEGKFEGDDGKCYDKIDCQHGGGQFRDGCLCIDGWLGDLCEKCTEEGKYEDPDGKCYDTIDCGDHGHQSQDTCVCDEGWAGNRCDTCDTGYDHYETELCYKTLDCVHGAQQADACVCVDGWGGTLCNQCNSIGKFEGDDGKCYDKLNCQHGGSQNKNACICVNNWSGTLCEVCSGFVGSDDKCYVSLDCGEHGHQNLNICVCDTGYAGANCSECDTGYGHYETDLCYATLNCVHGTQYADSCQCSDGWLGSLCNQCNGAGKFEGDDGKCYEKLNCQHGGSQYRDACNCANGWSGSLCERCMEDGKIVGSDGKCYAVLNCVHGHQELGACVCEEGYVGELCNSCDEGYGHYETDFCYATLNCVHGTQYAGSCQCSDGWEGTLCSQCNGVGKFEGADGKCYEKKNCQHGGHQENGDCVCANGWGGALCDECASINRFEGSDGKCYEKLACGSHGHQNFDMCVCDEGYAGDTCGTCASGYDFYGTTECHATLSCQHGGTQYGSICDCSATGWLGELCERCTEDGKVVGSDGKCYVKLNCLNGGHQENGVCVCTNGWSGTYCSECDSFMGDDGICYPTLACGEHGHQHNGECICDTGYTGFLCNTCAEGYDYHGTQECYLNLNCVHGSQQGAVCVCSDGWLGNLCDECNSAGKFEGDDGKCYDKLNCQHGGSQYRTTCNCVNDWEGSLCDVCNGFVGSDDKCYEALDCGAHGHQELNVCVCDEGYAGAGCNSCASGYDYYGTTECHATIADCNKQHEHQIGDECVCDNGYARDMVSGLCETSIGCQHGQQSGDVCVCDYGWEGVMCDVCPNNGFVDPDDGGCYVRLNCQHGGHQSKNLCICENGWEGTSCEVCNGFEGTDHVCYESLNCGQDKGRGYQELDHCNCYMGYAQPNCATCSEGYDWYGTTDCHATIGCVHGTQQGDVCECSDGWSGALCDECTEAGKVVGTDGKCYDVINCNYGTQVNDGCVCDEHHIGEFCDTACVHGYQENGVCNCGTTGWSGELCERCTEEGKIVGADGNCYDVLDCGMPIYSGSTRTGGHQENGICVCDTGYAGAMCDSCSSGYGTYEDGGSIHGCFQTKSCGSHQHQRYSACVCDESYTSAGTSECYPVLNCVSGQGVQVGDKCICKNGYKGDLCEIEVSSGGGTNFNFNDGEWIVSNEGNETVIGLDYNPNLAKVEDGDDLYNAYRYTSNYIGNTDAIIRVVNNGTGSTYGMRNLYGDIHLSNDRCTSCFSRVYVTHNGSNENSRVYGLYSEYNIYDTLSSNYISSLVDVKNNGRGETYGAYAARGDVKLTDSEFCVDNAGLEKTYGLYANNSVIGDYRSEITVIASNISSSANAYGVYSGVHSAHLPYIDVTNSGSGDAYGYYTIDSAPATVQISGRVEVAANTGKAVAFYYGGGGTATLGNNNGYISLSATSRDVYLFMAPNMTIINNMSVTQGSLLAKTVLNYKQVNVNSYTQGYKGIVVSSYAENYSGAEVRAVEYGIYGENATIRNTGTINASGGINSTGVLGKQVINSRGGTISGYTGVIGETVNNDGVINGVRTEDDGRDIYGVYSVGGGVYNSYNISATNDYTHGIRNATGVFVKDGEFGNTGTISSSGDISVSGTLYGVKAENAIINNNGTIQVSYAREGSRYGIYAVDSTVNNNSGGLIKIDVGAEGNTYEHSYGIYADNSEVHNDGTINIRHVGGIGIYAVNNSVVYNNGSIKMGSYTCAGDTCFSDERAKFIVLDETSTFGNGGSLTSDGIMNLSSFGGTTLLLNGGSFEAPAISGDLGVDSSVVSQGFEDEYSLLNSIISDDTSKLNIYSRSAMFEAKLEGQNVVLKRKNFAKLYGNSSFADFLEKNYLANNNEDLFKVLKDNKSLKSLKQTIKDLSADGIKRFAFEDFSAFKELNLSMNDALYNNH